MPDDKPNPRTVKLGFVLEINGQEIALEPRTAVDAIGAGIEVGLPAGTEVRLGSAAGGLQSFVSAISKAFGGGDVTLPTLPSPLDQATDYVSHLDVTINDLWIRFPPKLSDTPKDYRIGVYVSGRAIDLVTSAIKFKGFAVQIAAGAGLKP